MTSLMRDEPRLDEETFLDLQKRLTESLEKLKKVEETIKTKDAQVFKLEQDLQNERDKYKRLE